MKIRSTIRAIDAFFGTLSCFIFLSARKKHAPRIHNPQTIVFLKLWAIGESVLTLPTIQAISKGFPTATITVLTTKYVAPVYSNQPFIHYVDVVALNPISYSWYILRHWRAFDMSIDGEPYTFISAWATRLLGKWSLGFATCGRDALYSMATPYNDQQHAVLTYGDLATTIGVAEFIPTTLVPLQYLKEDIGCVTTYLQTYGITHKKRFIVIASTVGGSAKGRIWPQERFVAVANHLATQYNLPIILLGSVNDTRMLKAMNDKITAQSIIATHFSLSQAAYILQQSCILIANDSGLMHIGSAMGTKILALFGQNTPVRFAPFTSHGQWIYRPCSKSPHINVHKREIPNVKCNCMKNITVEEVLELAQRMLG